MDKLGLSANQVYGIDRVLNISSLDILDSGTGNERLSAVDGVVYLTPGERTVLVTLATASGSITIYAPDPGECIGEFLYIKAVSVANSKTATVKNRAGETIGDALTTTADCLLLYAAGPEWVIVKDVTT